MIWHLDPRGAQGTGSWRVGTSTPRCCVAQGHETARHAACGRWLQNNQLAELPEELGDLKKLEKL